MKGKITSSFFWKTWKCVISVGVEHKRDTTTFTCAIRKPDWNGEKIAVKGWQKGLLLFWSS